MAIAIVLAMGCAKINNKDWFSPESASAPVAMTTPAGVISFEWTGDPEEIQIGDLPFALFPSAHVTTPTGEYDLRETGRGYRYKTIVFFEIPVYLSLNYIQDDVTLSKTDPLTGIAQSRVKIFQINLLYDVSAADISKALKDALAVNEIDPLSPSVAPFFAELNTDFKRGDRISLMTYSPPGGADDVLIIKTLHKSSFTGGPDMALSLWKIWFGKPMDAGGEKLKKELIGEG